ncbi:hypothetical protein TNCV_3973391 [Trichonephila clavipes]|nr:hypothetical protein TNCV_3973391 [Trichonephila clavipes]
MFRCKYSSKAWDHLCCKYRSDNNDSYMLTGRQSHFAESVPILEKSSRFEKGFEEKKASLNISQTCPIEFKSGERAGHSIRRSVSRPYIG